MSFLKQLLTPFVAFDEEEKKAPPVQPAAKPASAPPSPVKPAAAPVPAPVVDVEAHHPLIDGGNSGANTAAQTQMPVYSPGGTITVALPEHEQYFEKLIADANINNPMFQGTDFKEFVDSKVDIDDITDETIKYRTAFNVLKSTGLTKRNCFLRAGIPEFGGT
jgi:hypothetical protein